MNVPERFARPAPPPSDDRGRSRRPGAAGAAGFRLLCVGAGLLLGGCGSARVSDVRREAGTAPRPGWMTVVVDGVPTAANGAGAAPDGAELASLRTALLRKLYAQDFAIRADASSPDTAVLHVTVTRVDHGSRLVRLTVGFGAGRAVLRTRAELDLPGRRLLSFDTTANSGRKPGLVLPGGVAAATGDVLHLAIGGGIDVALGAGNGMSGPIDETATGVMTQLRACYTSEGWTWPRHG